MESSEKNNLAFKVMPLISLLAKTTHVPLATLSSALRKLRNLTCLALITLFVMDKKSKLK